MYKGLFAILFFLAPVCSFAQNGNFSDTSQQRIEHEDCDDKFFTKVETIATLKNGIKNYEDSLMARLDWSSVFEFETKATFEFLLTTSLHIYEFNKTSGDINKELKVKKAILRLVNMWTPAIQNGRAVCYYVHLSIEFVDNGLIVTVK